jgi:hypothetical protein
MEVGRVKFEKVSRSGIKSVLVAGSYLGGTNYSILLEK